MKKQTVYTSINGEPKLAITLYESGEYVKGVIKKEAYVFTPEELKQLLQDYTDKIVVNVFAQSSRSNITSRSGLTCINYGDVSVNKESISSELPKFLKEMGYE